MKKKFLIALKAISMLIGTSKKLMAQNFYTSAKWDMINFDLWANNLNIATGLVVDAGYKNMQLSLFTRPSILSDDIYSYAANDAALLPESGVDITKKRGLEFTWHFSEGVESGTSAIRLGLMQYSSLMNLSRMEMDSYTISSDTSTFRNTQGLLSYNGYNVLSGITKINSLLPSIGYRRTFKGRYFDDAFLAFTGLSSIEEGYWYFDYSPFSIVQFDQLVSPDGRLWEFDPDNFKQGAWRAGFYITFPVTGAFNMFSDFSIGTRPGVKRAYMNWSFGFIMASYGKN